jgi:hypothetical protein
MSPPDVAVGGTLTCCKEVVPEARLDSRLRVVEHQGIERMIPVAVVSL